MESGSMTDSNRPGFTGATIDRADALRMQPDRLAEFASSKGARLMDLDSLEPPLDDVGRLRWTSLNGHGDLIFLGLDGSTPLFAPLIRVDTTGPRPPNLFATIEAMDPGEAALWGTARSLVAWHNRHGFCSNCGAETAIFRGGWGRKCARCGADHFPRVDPVVIMLAEHGDKVLLGRQPQFPTGRYSALAGFVEPGESIEEAVARELFEEAGIRVTNVRYVASQPWPFPSTLMVACIATGLSEELVIDHGELEDAKWIDRAEVQRALAGDPAAGFNVPPAFAIAHTLLRHWAAKD
jgi:NAD+ diphosphatase